MVRDTQFLARTHAKKPSLPTGCPEERKVWLAPMGAAPETAPHTPGAPIPPPWLCMPPKQTGKPGKPFPLPPSQPPAIFELCLFLLLRPLAIYSVAMPIITVAGRLQERAPTALLLHFDLTFCDYLTTFHMAQDRDANFYFRLFRKHTV